MRISVLADNRTLDDAFKTEHGLCIHLDTGKIKVLLDTGASDVFIGNASALGIDLTDVDYVFISHAHRDHAGGLSHILRLNQKVKVIVSSEALRSSCHSSRKGMHDITPEWPYELMEDRLIAVDEEMDIAGMRVIPYIARRHPLPMADKCLYRRNADGSYSRDEFRHEMALQIEDFLFTGCAHSGLMNILESASDTVRTVLGGFHLLDSSEGEDFESGMEIRQIASDIHDRYPETVFYTGHCTGDNAFDSMKQVLGHRLLQFSCGMSIEI